jgi:hypothetical protein
MTYQCPEVLGFFFETRSHYIALTGLELTPSCLSMLSAGITGMCYHHAQQDNSLKSESFNQAWWDTYNSSTQEVEIG